MKRLEVVGKKNSPHDTAILLSSFLMMPIILLYGIYVQINGEVSPGGGFQSGVIFAVVYMLYVALFDAETALHIVSLSFFYNGLLCGVLIYLGTGLFTMMAGGSFLEYAVLAENFSVAQQIGVMAVETGVGLTVFCAMVIFYLSFVLQGDKSDS